MTAPELIEDTEVTESTTEEQAGAAIAQIMGLRVQSGVQIKVTPFEIRVDIGLHGTNQVPPKDVKELMGRANKLHKSMVERLPKKVWENMIIKWSDNMKEVA